MFYNIKKLLGLIPISDVIPNSHVHMFHKHVTQCAVTFQSE